MRGTLSRCAFFLGGGVGGLCTRKGTPLALHSEARAAAEARISWGVAMLWDRMWFDA